jgi:hypothetical protein
MRVLPVSEADYARVCGGGALTTRLIEEVIGYLEAVLYATTTDGVLEA